jgi:hypothetical protein
MLVILKIYKRGLRIPTTYKHQMMSSKPLKLNGLGVLTRKSHTFLKGFESIDKRPLMWNVSTACRN